MVGLLALSIQVLRKSFGESRNLLLLLGYGFPLALLCAMVGQTSLFLLLGAALFLRFHRSHPFWAGAALWFCTLKPHLFVPWGFVLLLWILRSRQYRIVLGLLSLLAASCLLTEVIDPSAWTQYIHWARTSGISSEFIPSLSAVLRRLVAPAAWWVEFLPCMAGTLWAVTYFWRRRTQWDWLADGSFVMLVSIVVAPYSWVYDQSLAIPALLFAAFRTSSRWLVAVLSLTYMAVEIELFRTPLERAGVNVWAPLVWFVWFVLARKFFRTPAGDPQLRSPVLMES